MLRRVAERLPAWDGDVPGVEALDEMSYAWASAGAPPEALARVLADYAAVLLTRP
jgi:hypothetical protein